VGRTFGVLLVLLAMLGFPGSECQGQSSGQQASGFQLKQNYPNPFNPETTIPFTLNEDLFVDGRPVVVSMRAFNMIQQLLASPVALDHPQGEVPLIELEYTEPGEYRAHWDGKTRNGKQVASGLYIIQLTVNGESKLMRIFVAK
jgi:hypothetical protein